MKTICPQKLCFVLAFSRNKLATRVSIKTKVYNPAKSIKHKWIVKPLHKRYTALHVSPRSYRILILWLRILTFTQPFSMYSKCTKKALFCVPLSKAFFVHFKCIAVHCSCLHITIEKSGVENQVWPQRACKGFFQVTRNSQNLHPGETYPNRDETCFHIAK